VREPVLKNFEFHQWGYTLVLNMIRFPNRYPTGLCNSEPDPDRT